MIIYECPMGHVVCPEPANKSMLPLHCMECEGELVPIEYVRAFTTPEHEAWQTIIFHVQRLARYCEAGEPVDFAEDEQFEAGIEIRKALKTLLVEEE